jgi:hypothetical protein
MSHENFWFRTLFKIKLYEAAGESFQRLFQDIMSYRYPDFRSVAPYGNQGDGGNDGWIPSELRYFQVYGKKASSELNLSYIQKKIIEDFEKIRNCWGEVKKYHFVYNDRFDGAPAPIQEKLKELQTKYALEEANVWAGRELERLFIELDQDQKTCIVGDIPSQFPDFIDSTAVSEILRHLAYKVSPLPPFLGQAAPDFSEKIKINKLISPVSDDLILYSRRVSDVDDFLDRQYSGLKQEIAQDLKKLYNESCVEIPDRTENAANIRYVWMVEQLIPSVAQEHPHTLKAYREAAQVVLAKYFEACDIYEHPDSVFLKPMTEQHQLF